MDIPNNHGGFEQFAEYISVGLVERGHEVTVYSPHYHPYKGDEDKGVRIKHVYSPELWMGGSIGSFFYDYSCLKDTLRNVCGTNPSLLEAMASDCFILAHDNIFNRAVLGDNAMYYDSPQAVTELLDSIDDAANTYKEKYTGNNLEVIRKEYSWDKLVDEHEQYFKWMMEQGKTTL